MSSRTPDRTISRSARIVIPTPGLIIRIFLIGITFSLVSLVCRTLQRLSGSLLLLCLDGSSVHPFVVLLLIIPKHILLRGRSGGRRGLDAAERTLKSSFFEPSSPSTSTASPSTSSSTSSSSTSTSTTSLTGVNYTQPCLRICFFLRSPRLFSGVGVAR